MWLDMRIAKHKSGVHIYMRVNECALCVYNFAILFDLILNLSMFCIFKILVIALLSDAVCT